MNMYDNRREFEERITDFTIGTGQMLALLPSQNATGNVVKIIKRPRVRIKLTNYNPVGAPPSVDLSIVPYLHCKEKHTVQHAAEELRPLVSFPTDRVTPIP
jgi:multidrug resistance efflux pump